MHTIARHHPAMSPAVPDCNVKSFSAALRAVSVAQRLVVAYSGGMDSHVLLHLLAMLREDQTIELQAVHVNHRLQPQAEQWCAHCAEICAALAVPLHVAPVDARPAAGESPEAAARRARYAACVGLLQAGQELVTAHTSDDQAETLLLRLLRGSGVDGAVGIRPRRALGDGWVIRPLLGFSRSALHDYACQAELQWIEDPSNRDLRYDRNFIRQRVLPMIEQRWPAAAAVLARDAANFADSVAVLETLAREDLAAAAGVQSGHVSVSALRRLVPARRAMVLRQWLREFARVTPSHTQLQQVAAILAARPDSQPRVRIGDVEVCRYRDELVLVSDADVPVNAPLRWSMQRPLRLAQRESQLTREELTAAGLTIPDGAVVEVRYRNGGERIRLAGHAHSKSLKKLFQEHAVPPWWRDKIPLIYVDGELAAVLGIGVAAKYSVNRDVCAEAAKRGV
ncbi:MAG: tRNA lysidine(34) synthetase TilS [Gammaproteobacteria bacterium]|nr:tRNA lysidine(34) synthetase TilS [Gammaproteobacteria bacterium]